MNVQKHLNFIIHTIYYTIIIAILYYTIHDIIPLLFPFICGFTIAFLLRPFIKKITTRTHIKLVSNIVITLFYLLIFIIIGFLLIKGFSFIKQWIITINNLYQDEISYYLRHGFQQVEAVFSQVDQQSAQWILPIFDNLQSIITSFFSNISKTFLSFLTKVITATPKFIIAFILSILSSFFINADYSHITTSLFQIFPKHMQNLFIEIKIFITSTLKQIGIAYLKLLSITFIELSIGLSILQIPHAIYIALGIALFDILPVLGTGGIMLPWILICILNNHIKLGVGLLILYLIIALLRSILEPKILGKQIGIHPIMMLLTMYVGAKIFGALGFIILPLLILFIQKKYLNQKKLR